MFMASQAEKLISNATASNELYDKIVDNVNFQKSPGQVECQP